MPVKNMTRFFVVKYNNYLLCMKQLLIATLLLFAPFISFAETNLVSAVKQWFESFDIKNNGSDFVCKTQCFIILPSLGSNEYLEISGNLSGKWQIGYGYLNGDQIIAWWFHTIEPSGMQSKKFIFGESAFFSQIPKEMPVILIVNGEISWSSMKLELSVFTPFERLKAHFTSATRYLPFTPRTINFLEWPMWGGMFINKAFYSWIIFLLFVALVWSLFEKNHHHSFKKSIMFGFAVLVFFWIFFDLFSTNNQIKMYTEFKNAPSFMANGRLAKDSDFYDFFDFIQTKVSSGSLGNFIVPYPYDGEGKYHMYPYIKFHDPEKLEYVFTYNPYGPNAPFGFVDPVYDASSKILSWKPSETRSYTWKIREVLSFGNYGKIYVIQP